LKRSMRFWISAVLLMGILSGCVSKSPVTQEASTQPTETAKLEPKTSEDQNEVENHKEKQLVLLFKALQQMDQKAGLTLSKKQAEELLPLIRKSRDEGEISAVEQTQALALLNSGQKAFYDDFSSKINERMEANRKRFESLTPAERDKLIENFQKQRQHLEKAPHPSNLPDNDTSVSLEPDIAYGKSMEQQLIDLLESKLTK
jgi:hypothetical protein